MATTQEMLDELNDHEFNDVPTARLLALLNDTYFDVCAREPWPFLETYADSTTILSDGTVGFGITDMWKVLQLRDYTNNRVLRWRRHDDVIEEYGNQKSNQGPGLLQTGNPWCYFIVGDSIIRTYPVQTSGVTLRLNYLKYPSALTITGANPILPVRHHRILVLGALAKAYDMIGDTKMGNNFNKQFEARYQTMRNDLHVVQYDSPDMIYDVRGE